MLEKTRGQMAVIRLSSEMFRLCDGSKKGRFGPRTLKSLPGVYQILATDCRGSLISLNRVGGRDSEGTLYIGCAVELRRRLRDFRNVACPAWDKHTGHAGAVSYSENSQVQKICGPDRLYFRFEHNNDYVDREKELLEIYLQEFGEVPPLNFSR